MQANCQIYKFSPLTNIQKIFYFANVLPYLLSDVFVAPKYAYVFDKGLCAITVLLHIIMIGFFLHSNDFALLILNTAWRMFCSPLSVLQTLSHRCATQIWHLLHSYISISVSSATTLSLVSSDAFIGGGSSRIAWATVQPYAISQPTTLQDCSILCYVAYIEKVNIKAYLNDQFFHTVIPPLVVSQLLNLTVARSIVASHGIVTGSHCNAAHLKSLVEQHECISCPSYLTIFSVESDPATKHAICTRNYRKKKMASTMSGRSTDSAEFPPTPSSIELEHNIIRDVCK